MTRAARIKRAKPSPTSAIKIGRRRTAISSPDKLFYPAARFRKIDVVKYYVEVAPFLLPHFRDRPVTLKRYPNGVYGEVFYEKDAPAFTPDWVKTFPVPRREGGPDINYIVINDVATLAWTADMACLELHPFLHRVPRVHVPSHIVFDLDPGEGTDIRQCIEVAVWLRELLTKLRLKAFAKVSGSKGLQIYVPLNTPVTYAATQPFAHALAELLERQHPDQVVSDMAKNLRHGKVFIDWSQNADHKTTIGVYSLRAKRDRPYVSMPVRWEELKRSLKKGSVDALYFEPDAALRRASKSGDIFAPVLKLKQKLPAEFRRQADIPHPIRHSHGASGARSSKLEDYAAKRHFDRTSEPAPELPKRSRQGSRRRFVVQKHAASHLHFDFRLEMNDVLKSWAVPKGLPLREGERHTGFETEDHPLDYLEFEGIIPEGEYGGGTVQVWDIGTYELIEGSYWKGAMAVFLTGRKLKGEWNISRLQSEDEKAKWLITKTGGSARPISKRAEAISALTGKTMDDIAREKTRVWKSSRTEGSKHLSAERSGQKSKEGVARHGKQRLLPVPAPAFVQPMKATAVMHLPEGDEWSYEIKWDGYRALALKHGNDVRLLSLKEKSLTTDFPSVVSALRNLAAHTAVLDGEIVAVNAEGCPSFQVLQNRKKLGRGWSIVYYAFDLLNRDGEDLRRRPLQERKARLRDLLKNPAATVRYNADLAGTAEAVLRSVKEAGLEGIVAKRRDSPYRAGSRVTTWLKLKLTKGQEFVIGGYKPDAGSFQSILVGYYEGAKLMFAGKVRQGFNPPSRAKLLKEMRPLLTARCPFANLPSSKRSHFGEGITAEEMTELCWLKPELVTQISFTEWTNYGLLRHATFEGLRDDKSPREIIRELS